MTVRIALLALSLLICAAPSAFAQSREDELREHVRELRQRLAKAEDEMLDMARNYDKQRKRLQDQQEALLGEVAELKKENALLKAKLANADVKKGKKKGKKGKKKDGPLDTQQVTLHFDETPLNEVLGFLQDISGLNVVLDNAIDGDDTTISLRLKDISLRNALNLIVAGVDDAEWVWDKKTQVVRVRKKR